MSSSNPLRALLREPLSVTLQCVKRSLLLNCRPSRSAFSLMEVTIALALVTFSMTVILGLLPVGLKTVQDAAIEQGLGRIAQQMRAEFQQMPFTASIATPNYSIKNLEGNTYYYNRQGFKTEESDNNTYFLAQLSLAEVQLPDKATDSFHSNAQTIAIKVDYPASAPTAHRNSMTFTMIVAR